MAESKRNHKNPFYKKRPWRIAFLILGIISIFIFAFIAYIYAQTSRIFDGGIGSGTQLFRNFRKDTKNESNLRGARGDRVNIVVLGMGGSSHPGGQLTDSVMILSLRPSDNAFAILSIPRDLYVPVADHKNSTKLNEVYSIGEKEKKGNGASLVKKTLETVLGIPIQYYITVDFKGFEKLIDEIGGIDIFVDKTIYDPYYPDENMEGYEPFYIKTGQHHLDGKTALKYARSRETSSDFDRAARQQKILTATKDKTLSLGFLVNPKKILDISAIIGEHVHTDISPNEIKSLTDLLRRINNDKTSFRVLSNETNGPLYSDSSSGTYYLLPRGDNFDRIHFIVKEIFDYPESQDTVIEVRNGTKTGGLGQRVSNIIKGYGYEVKIPANDEESYKKTSLIDYTGGKQKVILDLLKDKFGAKLISDTGNKPHTGDIVLIVGEDYKLPAEKNTFRNSDE